MESSVGYCTLVFFALGDLVPWPGRRKEKAVELEKFKIMGASPITVYPAYLAPRYDEGQFAGCLLTLETKLCFCKTEPTPDNPSNQSRSSI